MITCFQSLLALITIFLRSSFYFQRPRQLSGDRQVGYVAVFAQVCTRFTVESQLGLSCVLLDAIEVVKKTAEIFDSLDPVTMLTRNLYTKHLLF
jgi:hypothetical protein